MCTCARRSVLVDDVSGNGWGDGWRRPLCSISLDWKGHWSLRMVRRSFRSCFVVEGIIECEAVVGGIFGTCFVFGGL